jgi:hypothetical protein
MRHLLFPDTYRFYGPATAFPVQFDNLAVRKRFASPWTKKNFMVALGIG